MKSLVLYYSRTGKTKLVAEKISQFLNCDIEEIKEMKDRKGIFGFLIAGYEASRRKLTQIQDITKNLNSYELVILCSPVWASSIPPAVRTFLTKFSNEIKNLGLVITFNGIGKNKFLSQIQEIFSKPLKFFISLKAKEIKSSEYLNKIAEFVYEKN